MSNSTFSYKEITATSEERIAATMKTAKASRAKGNIDSANSYEFVALGMFLLWSALTTGHQVDDDYKRLEALSDMSVEGL